MIVRGPTKAGVGRGKPERKAVAGVILRLSCPCLSDRSRVRKRICPRIRHVGRAILPGRVAGRDKRSIRIEAMRCRMECVSKGHPDARLRHNGCAGDLCVLVGREAPVRVKRGLPTGPLFSEKFTNGHLQGDGESVKYIH